jgi:DNA uptake protein ComE-like DNA-binding protein
MNTPTAKTFLSAALLALAATLSMTAGEPAVGKGTAPKVQKSGAPAMASRTKGKLKPVDINSAPKNELGFMLGIPEDLAAKIIAGRPYRSKAHLLTRQVVSADVYTKIKDKIIAKQSGLPK